MNHKYEITTILAGLLASRQLPASLVGRENLAEFIYEKIYGGKSNLELADIIKDLRDLLIMQDLIGSCDGDLNAKVKARVDLHLSCFISQVEKQERTHLLQRYSLCAVESAARNKLANEYNESIKGISNANFNTENRTFYKNLFMEQCSYLCSDNTITDKQKAIIKQLQGKIIVAFDTTTDQQTLEQQVKSIVSSADFQHDLRLCEKSLAKKFIELCLKVLTLGKAQAEDSASSKFNKILNYYPLISNSQPEIATIKKVDSLRLN